MRIEVTQRDSTINVSTSKDKGPKGDTPYIQDGTWWIAGEDTGIKAVAEDGVNPEIGQNGNWYIGDTDTGVTARGPAGADALTPEFRTYYPPPVIENPSLNTSVTDSAYTTNFNQAVQQPGVFQWKYTTEDDTAWRDEYLVAPLTDPLEYYLVEGDPADLQDVDLIQQLTPVASGTDVSQLSGTGALGSTFIANIYVKDQAGNVSVYNHTTVNIPDPFVESIDVFVDGVIGADISGNADDTFNISWDVITNESSNTDAVIASTDESVVVLSNIDYVTKTATATLQPVESGNTNTAQIRVTADLDNAIENVDVTVNTLENVPNSTSTPLTFDVIV